MKIIRHGYFKDDACICDECGCVFQPDGKELDEFVHLGWAGMIRVDCPECGHDFCCDIPMIEEEQDNEDS